MSWGDDVLKIALANPDVIVPDDAQATGKAKRNKFGNVRVEFDGMKFDSKAELSRYGDLRLLELTGHITELQTQPIYVLTAGVKYKGDFQYIEDGKTICEDVKGFSTPSFKNKWKQAKELYPNIEFRLIMKQKRLR